MKSEPVRNADMFQTARRRRILDRMQNHQYSWSCEGRGEELTRNDSPPVPRSLEESACPNCEMYVYANRLCVPRKA